jgi:hypothetical protein
MEKDCSNDPAMAATFNTDFKAGAGSIKGWKQTAGSLTYSPEGAQFTVNKKGDSPTIQSETYLHFGYVEVKCKAASGQGIISSIVLQSEDLDEVDWEFIGTVSNTVQMNYFGKGNTTTYDRMIEAPVSNVQTEMHTYALDWTAERLIYIIDGTPVRTLNFGDANGGKNYPQTPSTVRIGIWAGGDPDNEKGVIEWAGGVTDYTKAPFTMTVESVKVKNYSPGKEYKWTDKSGSWQSIEVIGKGDENGAPQNSEILEPTASASGGGLQSGVKDVPSATASATGTAPQESGTAPHQSGVAPAPGMTTSCTTGQQPTPYPTGPVPQESSVTPQESDVAPPPYPTSPSSHNGTVPEAPCSCDDSIVTVTLTGPSPPAETPVQTPTGGVAPPPVDYPVGTPTGGVIPPPVGTPTTLISSGVPASSSSPAAVVPPVTDVPAVSPPPYPTGGIQTDTHLAPSVPVPTGGYGTTPPASNTSVPLPFDGAASTNKAGAFVVLVAAAALLAV